MGLTVPVAGDGVALLYCAIVLLVLTWFFYVLRIWVRVWRKAFGTDDYLMLVGIILFSVTASLCIVCSHYGSGQHAGDLPPLTMAKGVKLFYIAEYFYAVSAMFIKISIAVTLMRIAETHQKILWILWALIFFTIVAAVVFVVGIANICRPIGTLWGEAAGKCDLQLNTDVSLFFSAIEILVDVSLSVMPAVLLWNIQMDRKVKISVAAMLALASFASCATIIRLKYLTLYSDPSAFIYGTGKIGLWSLAEEGFGIIAGTLPTLRPLLSMRIRITTSSHTPAASRLTPHPISSHKTPSRPSAMAMDTFVTLGDDDTEHSDGDSQRNIVKQTHYTVTATDAGNGDEMLRSQVLGWEDRKISAV